MRKIKFRYMAATLCCVAALTVSSLPVYATNTALQDAKKQVSSLEEEKEKTEAALKELENLKSDTETYVRQLDANLNAINQELKQLEEQIVQKESQIAEAQKNLETARETESRQYEAMKLRIKYMYEQGNTSFLDLLLESEDISRLLNRAEYISKITEYDRDMLNRYAQTRADIANREAALETEHEELLTLQASAQAKQQSAQTLLDSKQAELKAYNSRIASAQEQIAGYEADIAAQEAEMRRIEEEQRRREEEARKKAQEAGKTYTVSNLGNISFKWPCPSSSRITSGFGDRESPTEGASTSHKGIDIGAAAGADIVAAADGQVVISTYSYSAGNYIMIDHGGGVSTVYMHCSQLLVSKGTQVSKGQTIAKVGSTGYSTGPHLHFGIRSGGAYVNPSSYVSP